jgi:hypothetical protein
MQKKKRPLTPAERKRNQRIRDDKKIMQLYGMTWDCLKRAIINGEKSELTQEMALALEVASIAQTWGNPSPFQDKINELLARAGRKPLGGNPNKE